MKNIILYLANLIVSKYGQKLHNHSEPLKQIEIDNGESVHLKGFKNRSNFRNGINTRIYSIYSVIYLIPYYYFHRIANLYFLLINILCLCYLDQIRALQISYLLSLIMGFTAFSLKELYYDYQKIQFDEAINSRLVTIFSRFRRTRLFSNSITSEKFVEIKKYAQKQKKDMNIVEFERMVNSQHHQETDLPVHFKQLASQQRIPIIHKELELKIPLYELKRWDEIEIGDVIYLKQNEICPADILILEQSNIKSYANSSIMSGNTNEIRKKPCQLTSMGKEHKQLNIMDYRRILNGVVKYEQLKSDPYYKGFLKLKKDPQSHEIMKENIFFREQQIVNSQYLYGIVLEVGKNCRCYQNMKIQRKDSGFFETKANYYFIISILVVLLFTLADYINFISSGCVDGQFTSFVDGQHMLYILEVYTNLLPQFFYVFLDSLDLIQVFLRNRRFRTDSSTNLDKNKLNDFNQQNILNHNFDFNQNNNTQIGDMALVNHIILDKTGTLTNGEFSIKFIFIYDSLFKIKQKSFLDKGFQDHVKKSRVVDYMKQPIIEQPENESPYKKRNTKVAQTHQSFQLQLEAHNDDNNNEVQDLLFEEQHYEDQQKNNLTKPPIRNDTVISSKNDLSQEDSGHHGHSSRPRIHSQSKKLLRKGSGIIIVPKLSSNLEIVSEAVHNLDEFELISRWQEEEFRPHLIEALYVLGVCHNTRTLYQESSDSFCYEYSSNLDQLQLDFVSNYGLKFICNSYQDQLKYIIQENEEFKQIDLMAIHQFNSRRLSVIIKIPTEWHNILEVSEEFQYIQYLRDDSIEMIGCLGLEKEQAQKLDNMIHDIQFQGNRVVMYYRTFLNEEQVDKFIKEANKIIGLSSKQMEYTQEYQFLMHEFQKNCDLVQLIGVKEKLKPQVKQTLSNFQATGIQCWLASGDSFEKVLPIAYKCGLIDRSDSYAHINGHTSEDLYIQIKSQLQQLASQLKQRINYQNKSAPQKQQTQSVDQIFHRHSKLGSQLSPSMIGIAEHVQYQQYLISGDSLSMICQDHYLKKHFIFLLQFTKHLAGYLMSTQQKTLLIDLLKNNHIHYKNILSIGDSFSDIGLFNNSDFSIQVHHQRIYKNSQAEYVQHLQRSHKLVYNHYNSPLNPLNERFEYQDILPFPNVNIFLKEIKDIDYLLSTYNQIQAQMYENVLIFSFFRSLNMISILMVFQNSQCLENTMIIDEANLMFYPNVFYIILFIFMVIKQLRNDKTVSKELVLFAIRLSKMEYRKSKVFRFAMRICIFPIILAIISNIILNNILQLQTDPIDGKSFNMGSFSSGLFLTYLILELIKIYQRDYLNLKLLMIASIFAIGLYMLSNLYKDEQEFHQEWILQTFQFFNYTQVLFAFIFIIMMNLIFNVLTSLLLDGFFQTRYVETQNHLKEFQSIYSRLRLFERKTNINHHNTFQKINKITRRLFKNDDDIDGTIKQMVSGVVVDETMLKINKFTLKFKNNNLEQKFLQDNLEILVKGSRAQLIITYIFCDIVSFLFVKDLNEFKFYQWFDYFHISAVVTILLCLIISRTKYYYRQIFHINLIVQLIRTATIISFYYRGQSIGSNIMITQLYLIQIILSVAEMPIISITAGFAILVFNIVYQSGSEQGGYLQFNHILLIVFSYIVITFTYQRLMLIFRDIFITKITMIKENNAMSDVLGILLPKFILNRINQSGQFEIQENQGNVAILFCDICDFDHLIKEYQKNIVHLLDKLFRQFDQLCMQHGVQKIETVGKTYMAAAGLNDVQNQIKINPVHKVINLAMDMKKYVKELEITIKIGIHYGQVIAGVIGHHKPQFSLIGDTINTTSRVCSTASNGQIVISDSAFQNASKLDLSFEPKKVEAKGKGILQTYIISQKRHMRPRMMTMKIIKQNLKFAPHPQQHSMESHNSDEKNEKELLIQQRINISPQRLNRPRLHTIIAPSIRLDSQMSSSNLEGKPSQVLDEDRYAKNLIQALEKITRQELNVSQNKINQEFEIEQEKIKALMQAEEEIQISQSLQLKLDPKRLYLRFEETSKEKIDQFYEIIRALYQKYSFWFQMTTGIFVMMSDGSITMLNNINYLVNTIVGLLVGSMYFVFAFLIRVNYNNSERYFQEKNFIILSFLLLATYTLDCFNMNNHDYAEVQLSKGILYMFSININRIIKHEIKFVINICFLVTNITSVIYQGWPRQYLYYVIVFQFFGYLIQLLLFYKNVSAYNVTLQLNHKQQQQSNLLLYLLPQHILQQFFHPNQDSLVLVEEFENVTLLFADIAGFTEYSSKVQPEQVVNMLRNLFTEFDKICLSQNVYKLYTIGDCYVVMGLIDGDPGSTRKPAEEAVNVVKLGFYMIDVIRRVRTIINFPGLDMRIGVHTGNIIGGVLGTELVRYDIYGPDVLIANKMESKGQKGFVQVSEQTKNLIQEDFPDVFRFEHLQHIEFESISRETEGYLVFEEI